jgi:holo-[acyl-carrier protein] synthase
MIIGVGMDIVEIARLQKSLQRDSGGHFLEHVFTAAEQAAAPENERQKYAYYAGRWAAKESLSKALGTGIGSRCALREIEILHGEDGKPEIALSGAALETAAQLGVRSLHVSISHEQAYACAIVIAES